jgi:hypothetical protein
MTNHFPGAGKEGYQAKDNDDLDVPKRDRGV